MKSEILKHLPPPYRYDKTRKTILDSEGNVVLDIKAWQVLQHFDNGYELHDLLGEMVCEAMNTVYHFNPVGLVEQIKRENIFLSQAADLSTEGNKMYVKPCCE